MGSLLNNPNLNLTLDSRWRHRQLPGPSATRTAVHLAAVDPEPVRRPKYVSTEDEAGLGGLGREADAGRAGRAQGARQERGHPHLVGQDSGQRCHQGELANKIHSQPARTVNVPPVCRSVEIIYQGVNAGRSEPVVSLQTATLKWLCLPFLFCTSSKFA